MKVTAQSSITPLYCIGASHALPYSNIVFGTDWSPELFACRTCFFREIAGGDYVSPEGRIHPALISSLQAASLLDANNYPEYLTRTPNLAFVTGLPVVAPPIVMFEGEVQIQSVYTQIGNQYDFRLPGDELYGFDETKQSIPIKAVRDGLTQFLQPLLTFAKEFRNAGFSRFILHGLPPRVLDDARGALWTKNVVVRAPIRAKVALLANQIVAAFCAENDIGYVDTWTETATDAGYLRPEFDLDGLHLTRTATLISLGKIAEMLFDRTGQIVNGARYEQAFARAPKNTTKDRPDDAQYLSRGFASVALGNDALQRAIAELDHSIRENRYARLDWAGAPRSGRQGLAAGQPGEAMVRNAAAILSQPEAHAILHAGSDVMLTVSAFRPIRIDAGTAPLPVSHGMRTPKGARRGLITSNTGLALTLETIAGGAVETLSLPPGTLFVFDASRVRCSYLPSDRPQDVVELCLIPRLPNHAFRVNWAGLCDWPGDPFQFTAHDMVASPAWEGAMVRERAREKEIEVAALGAANPQGGLARMRKG